MRIVSLSENLDIEKRVAITPEIVKKYNSLGFEVSLPKNYGLHLGFGDDVYISQGANILENDKELLDTSDVILQLGMPSDDNLSLLKENQNLIGVLNPFLNRDKLEKLTKRNINNFSLELLPRITRAQSMDILSSQANLAGYKAVIESFANFEKAIPMMMTAAGTVPAAKVLVVGAGVAGLQAIATAKRMGAIVFATDVRMASKEQVESLGGKFLTVEGSENLETEGGYAKEASDDFRKKQEELLSETLKKIDIIICTALIPGKKAPLIIKENMFENMQAGSVIYDLAAIQGGNTAFTEVATGYPDDFPPVPAIRDKQSKMTYPNLVIISMYYIALLATRELFKQPEEVITEYQQYDQQPVGEVPTNTDKLRKNLDL